MKHLQTFNQHLSESQTKPDTVEKIDSAEYYVLRDYRTSTARPTGEEEEKIKEFFKMLNRSVGVFWDRYKFNGIDDPFRYDYKPGIVKKYHPITVEKVSKDLWAAKGFYHDIIYFKSESLDSIIREMSFILTPEIEWSEIK